MILIINYQTVFRYSMSTLSIWANNPTEYPFVNNLFGGSESLNAWIRARIGYSIWTEELARYIFVWITYLAVSVSILSRTTIRVDVLHNMLGRRANNIVWITIYALSLFLSIIFLVKGVGHISMQKILWLQGIYKISAYVKWALKVDIRLFDWRDFY